jgi:hypothetical protein
MSFILKARYAISCVVNVHNAGVIPRDLRVGSRSRSIGECICAYMTTCVFSNGLSYEANVFRTIRSHRNSQLEVTLQLDFVDP